MAGGSATPEAKRSARAARFECETLDQYRLRYALYRSDPLLQAAHAQVPWIVTWDDHEVDNDYAGAISGNDDDPAGFLERRAAAHQAWYEFMPVRFDPPDGPDFDIYRSVARGDLVRFHVLDTWDGYAAERARLLEAVAVAADNVVVLTGDFHSAAVGELRADPFDLSLPVVGIEFMATSISSSFFDGDDMIAGLIDAALATNPQLRYFDSRRGYTLCEVTPTTWTATYRAVTDQFDEDSPVEAIWTWLVEAGTAAVSQTA